MRTMDPRGSIIDAYRRNYSASPASFLKRLTGYLLTALVVYAYGRPTTALVVLAALLTIDIVLTLALSMRQR